LSRKLAFLAGVGLLAIVWGGPLFAMAGRSFAAHMLMHMAVVAVAAPLIGHGLGGLAGRFALPAGLLAFPLLASLLELVVIWAWHTPRLHELARTSPLARVGEQVAFLIVATLVWGSAFRTRIGDAGASRLAGAGALFFTGMHMTMLGVILTLAPNPICTAPVTPPFGLSAMGDQQLGGVLMLGVGGLVYTAAGLALVARVLSQPTGSREATE